MKKEQILSAIRKNKPDLRPLPEIPAFEQPVSDLVHAFSSILVAGNGQVRIIEKDTTGINALIASLFPEATTLVSQVEGVEGNFQLPANGDPHELQNVDIAVIHGQLGVAENGAVWVPEEACGHRVLPFISQHLFLVINASDLVWNMHQAYQRIRVEETGFGVFIAGPSKTADIEQSLVVGAQGPRSLTVLVKV